MPTKFQLFQSYFYDVLLEKTSSAHNPYLEVMLSKGRMRLNTQNTTYSYEDLYANFYTTFEQIAVQQYQLSNVLVLGFGLGSIPLMLQRHFGQSAQYTGVDIDAVILQLAQKYLPKNILPHLNLYCADADQWVQSHQAPAQGYDLIAIDLFIDQNTPSPFYNKHFLQNTQALLNPTKGILVYNTLSDTTEQKLKAQHFYNHIFNPIFEGAFCIETHANLMLIYNATKKINPNAH